MDKSKEMLEGLAFLWLSDDEEDSEISLEDTESHVLFEALGEAVQITECTKDEDEYSFDKTTVSDLDDIIAQCNTGNKGIDPESVLYDGSYDLDHVLEWDWLHLKNSEDAL